MNRKPKLTWFVPRWAFLPKLWHSLQQCLLNRRTLARISAGSLLACLAVIVVFKLAFPLLVLPNLWTLALTLPAVLLALVLQFGVLAAIPPQVTLRQDRIQKSHGQSGLLIKAADVLSTHLYVHRNERVRLKIRYRRRGRSQALVVGVPPTVDLDQVVAMLPVEPEVRDARLRCISMQPNVA